MPTHSLLPQSVIPESLEELYGTKTPFLETPYLHVGRNYGGPPIRTQAEAYPLYATKNGGVLVDLPKTSDFNGAGFPFKDGNYEDLARTTENDIDGELGRTFGGSLPPDIYTISSANRERELQASINNYFLERSNERERLLREAMEYVGLTPDEVNQVLRNEKLDEVVQAMRRGQAPPAASGMGFEPAASYAFGVDTATSRRTPAGAALASPVTAFTRGGFDTDGDISMRTRTLASLTTPTRRSVPPMPSPEMLTARASPTPFGIFPETPPDIRAALRGSRGRGRGRGRGGAKIGGGAGGAEDSPMAGAPPRVVSALTRGSPLDGSDL